MQRVWDIALLLSLNKGGNACKLQRPMWFKQTQPPIEHVAGMPDGFGVVLLGVASGIEVLGQIFPTETAICVFASACMPDGCGDKISVAMECCT